MIVFVSPHFDDAIGSCGCLINKLVTLGESIQILTVFTGEHDGKVSEFAKKLLDLWKLKNGVIERNIENIKACNVLGVGYSNLPYIEALYRKLGSWLYPFDGDLFGHIHYADFYLPKEISSVISNIYSKDTIFYFPSGRGNHVDHILVKQVGELLLGNGFRVSFYTDFSYEGLITNDVNVHKVTRYFNVGDLEKKIKAFNEYKSQLKMLFKVADSREYFTRENMTEDGVVYEEYYESF